MESLTVDLAVIGSGVLETLKEVAKLVVNELHKSSY
jgi:hypothetical protein